MALKTSFNYSPNFNSIKRKPRDIKFIIFHYTGMKSESAAINRLTNIQSEVSSHYFIKISGEIITIVPDLYTAWHAGRSAWKNYNSLNKNSIGIEIANPGHGKGYKKFSRSQILSLIRLSKFLIQKYKISSKNILGHSDVAPDRKKDPGEKFPWKYLSQKHIGYWHNLDQKILVNNRMIKTNNLQKKHFLKIYLKLAIHKKFLKNLI
jgi:N-acetylmuramoyl-L-alanine amidase